MSQNFNMSDLEREVLTQRCIINEQSGRLDQAKRLLQSIVERHGETVCTDCECEVVESGCLGDALHNEILEARKFLS